MEEGEKLQKLREKLEQENQHLMGDKELNDMMIQDKVSETKHHKKQIKDVRIDLQNKSVKHQAETRDISKQILNRLSSHLSKEHLRHLRVKIENSI